MSSSVNTSPATTSVLESQLDEQFIVYMLEIDSRYKSMTKQDRVRVEQWVSESFAKAASHSFITLLSLICLCLLLCDSRKCSARRTRR